VDLIIGSREGHVCASMTRHVILFRVEELAPFDVGMNHFLHACRFQLLAGIVELDNRDVTGAIVGSRGVLRPTGPDGNQSRERKRRDPQCAAARDFFPEALEH